MDTKNPNFAMGMAFLSIGVALLIVLDGWFIGLPFLFMGAHRMYVAYVESNQRDASD